MCIVSFFNIDKFDFFKIAGYEARLKNTIEKAEITLQQYKNNIKVLTHIAMFQITYSNRLSDLPISETDEIRNDCITLRAEFEIEDQQFEDDVAKYNRYKIWDCYYNIIVEILNDNNIENNSRNQIIRILKEKSDFDTDNYPQKEYIVSVLSQYNTNINDALEKVIQAYVERVAKTSKI